MTQTGYITNPFDKDSKPIPLYSMDTFINTTAGWTLLGTDKQAYEKAKQIWESIISEQDKRKFEKDILDFLNKPYSTGINSSLIEL